MKFTLNQEQKDHLIIMAKALSGVTHASFDNDYGDGFLYIQKEGVDKAITIHWFEFLIFHISRMLAIYAVETKNNMNAWWVEYASKFVECTDTPIEDMVHPVDEAYHLYHQLCESHEPETGNNGN